MIKLTTIVLAALFALSLTSEARTITAYRTIIAATDTEEGAMELQTEGTDVVPYRGKFVVVSGWFDDFEDALPEGNNQAWNQRWRHVLPVEMQTEEMSAKGLRVKELKTQKALRTMGGLPERLGNREQLHSKMSTAVNYVKNTEMQPGAKTSDLVAALTPQIHAMVQLAERSPDPAEAEEAQLWLAKTYYLEGLMRSKQRLPETSGNYKRQAAPEEELAYDSAIEAYKTFLERFPNSEHAEEAAYHIAATQYHLTYRGHHRYQVEKAKQAYEAFIESYPNSELATRAKLNLLGISLELARMDGDEASFKQVIDFGELFLSENEDASEYIHGRAQIIVGETYYEIQEYETALQIADGILDQFSTDVSSSIVGTAHRLKAYSHYFLRNYAEAATELSFIIDYYNDPKFHFGYQVEENIAAAYYFRGMSLKQLGRFGLAQEDFEAGASQFEETPYGQSCLGEFEQIKNQLDTLN